MQGTQKCVSCFLYKEKSRTLLYDFSPQKNQDSNMKLKNGQNHPVTFMIIPHLACKCKRISDRFLTVFSESFKSNYTKYIVLENTIGNLYVFMFYVF